jgi:hypothetical protein
MASLCVLAAASSFAVTAANYDQIPVRNLFGLKDPPVAPPPGSEKPAPPPILLQGFTTVLGRDRVLFKVSNPAKPPQPATEEAKIMAAGERDGEITVLEINPTDGIVKFDNHGTVETRNMKDHSARPTGGSAVAGGGLPPPSIPQPMGLPQSPFAANASPAGVATPNNLAQGSRAGSLQNSPTRQTRSANVNEEGALTASGIPRPGVNWPPERHLSGEEQDLFIEVERERNKNNPNYPPLPPTSLNPNANVVPHPTSKSP